MSVEHYIMNETVWDGDYGEWTDRTQGGTATITQTTGSKYPTSRGRFGLHLDQTSADAVYLEKTLGAIAVPAGGSIYFGFYMKFIAHTATAGGSFPFRALFTSNWHDMRIYLVGDGHADKRKILLATFDDDAASHSTAHNGNALTLGDWVYIACRIQRASASGVSDGRIDLYIDGTLIDSVTGIKNYDLAATATTLYLGETGGTDDAEFYFDEIKVSTEYPVAYVAPPIGSLGFLGVGRM